MTLDKFIKVHNTKTFLKILTIVIVLTLFFFTLNLDFQDYIDGFSRLKGLIAGMMRIEAEDKKIVLFKMFETIITAFASSLEIPRPADPVIANLNFFPLSKSFKLLKCSNVISLTLEKCL